MQLFALDAATARDEIGAAVDEICADEIGAPFDEIGAAVDDCGAVGSAFVWAPVDLAVFEEMAVAAQERIMVGGRFGGV